MSVMGSTATSRASPTPSPVFLPISDISEPHSRPVIKSSVARSNASSSAAAALSPYVLPGPKPVGLSDNVNSVLSLCIPVGFCTSRHMKYCPYLSMGEFIWPSLTLLFSLVASAGCIVVFAYALLLVVTF